MGGRSSYWQNLKWKYLDYVVHNSQVPLIGNYVRNVSSILNKYKPPIKSNGANNIIIGFQMLMKPKENETAMQKLCLDHVTSLKYRTEIKNKKKPEDV